MLPSVVEYLSYSEYNHYYKGSSNLSGKRACNSEYHSVDGIALSVTINSYPYNHVNLT